MLTNTVVSMLWGGNMKNWICIRLDENDRWTADLYDAHDLVKNIGGSYARINQVIFDARQLWGDSLNVRVFPQGYITNINYKGEL